jgi:SAM-dependent methyltransferase
METIKDYNGRDYRTVWQHPRAKFEDEIETGVTKRLLSQDNGWFIDIGGGYGRLYPVLKKEGRNIVFADFAMNLLEIAEKDIGNNPDVKLVAANAYYMPFKDSMFDGGLSIRVFHHMSDPEKFMRECARILSSGGRIMLEWANKRNLGRTFKRGARALREDHEEYGELQYGTHPKFFKKIVDQAGFILNRTLGVGFVARLITEKNVALVPFFFRPIEKFLDAVFGTRDLGPLRFSDIQKTGQKTPPNTRSFEEILCCPVCKKDVKTVDGGMECTSCSRMYPKKGKIYDFRYTADAKLGK